jgi:AraC-like DNA-binding protein
MLAPAHHQIVPSAKGLITRLAYAVAEGKGIHLESLLQKSGLSHKQIHDPNARVEVRKQIRFLNLVSEAIGDDLLGFHMAQQFDLRRIGLLYYVFSSSSTLDEALARAARYSGIVNDGIRLTLRERGDTRVIFEYVSVARRLDRHQIEFWITGLVRACRQITHRRLTAERVSFVHRRKVTPEIRTFFGGKIIFGGPVDETAFSPSTRGIPVVGSDPYLNQLLLKYCEEALNKQRARVGSLAHDVENTVAILMPHGNVHAGEVARKLGLSERTLARRLASEGQTFSRILRKLRCELAKRHLTDKNLSISKIAWLLGYQDVSSFTHAFRRWTGKAPRVLRHQLH